MDANEKPNVVTGIENNEAKGLFWTARQLEQLTTKALACLVVSPVASYLCGLCTLTQREVALAQFPADLCCRAAFHSKGKLVIELLENVIKEAVNLKSNLNFTTPQSLVASLAQTIIFF